MCKSNYPQRPSVAVHLSTRERLKQNVASTCPDPEIHLNRYYKW
jgi:hypothetical protein